MRTVVVVAAAALPTFRNEVRLSSAAAISGFHRDAFHVSMWATNATATACLQRGGSCTPTVSMGLGRHPCSASTVGLRIDALTSPTAGNTGFRGAEWANAVVATSL